MKSGRQALRMKACCECGKRLDCEGVPESVSAPRIGSIDIVLVSKSRLRCLRTVFGLSPVDFKRSPNGILGSSTRASIINRSIMESGARLFLRDVKALIEGLTPKILLTLSVASRSFLVHRRKVIRPSTFQATQDTSGTANAANAASAVLREKLSSKNNRRSSRSNTLESIDKMNPWRMPLLLNRFSRSRTAGAESETRLARDWQLWRALPYRPTSS
jgi:hypothetical protein